jgi:murein DD-endopeptidase MepM/ murein hydrolase activator NlpD
MLVVSVTILSLVGSQVDSQDLEINLEYRSIQPGEVVRVILKSRRQIKRAYVIFNEEKYEMAKDIDQEAMLAFVGLDLNIKPGTYFIKILVQSQDGNTDHHPKEILVLPKEFPTTKLWVDERFVTPPNEVLERIRRESELIRTIYSVYTPQWLGEGVFILPSSGEPDANFGEKRIFNNKPRSSHSGVDISSPFGAEVIASNSGRILLANDLYFAGKSVIIDHGLGVFSFYCHFSKIIATRGTLVNKGEVIGEVGATGRVTGPHLHWSVRINGSRVDPFSLLSLSWD